jgi:hypothetical protein
VKGKSLATRDTPEGATGHGLWALGRFPVQHREIAGEPTLTPLRRWRRMEKKDRGADLFSDFA